MDILQLDLELFSLINGQWHNNFWDTVMPFWRNKLFWMPLYLFIGSFLVVNFPKKGFVVIALLLATVGLADLVSSRGLKKTVKRVRPCNEIALQGKARIVMKCGKSYSFTSSHATNHTAIAVFLIFTIGALFKWIKMPLLLWAISVGYGQIYIGAHYPLDVLGGILVGFLIGLFGASVCRLVLNRFFGGDLDYS